MFDKIVLVLFLVFYIFFMFYFIKNKKWIIYKLVIFIVIIGIFGSWLGILV